MRLSKRAIVLVAVTTAGCAAHPEYGPALEETIVPVEGSFIGTGSITTAYNAGKPVRATCNVSVTFYNGEYIIAGDNDDVVASSSGQYGVGSQFLLRHQRSDRVGAAMQQVLSGLFDYRWDTPLLVLEQWDPGRDRLTQLLLERTARADELLPYRTPNANAASPPFGPPRRSAALPTASTR